MPYRPRTHILALAVLAISPFAYADETYIGTNGFWITKSSWSNNAVPNSFDNVFVTPIVPAGTNTLTANISDGMISAANLTVGAIGGGTAILALQYGGRTANITIQSAGEIDLAGSLSSRSIFNQGMISTFLGGGGFSTSCISLLSNATITNAGTIRSQTSGGLYIVGNNTTLDNSNGSITANGYDGSDPTYGSIHLDSLHITGGHLSAMARDNISISSGSVSNATILGDIQVDGASFSLANVTFTGNIFPYTRYASTTFTVSGTLTATGSIVSPQDLALSGPVLLNGNGSLSFGPSAGSFGVVAGTPDASLTIAANQTLTSQSFFGTPGQISTYPKLTNFGALLGAATLYVPPADANGTPVFINRGTLTCFALTESSNATIGSIDNANGTISITGTSPTSHNPIFLSIQNMIISGGALFTDAKDQIQFSRTVSLANLTMAGNFFLLRNAAFSLTLSNVTLNGTLTANANLTSTTPLTGTGALSLAANASLSSGPLQLTSASLAGTAQIRPNTGASLLHSLTLASTGSLDLTTNALILTDPTASAAIQSDIAAKTLFSSTAPLVFIDNSQRATPYTTFAGQTVSPNTLLIAPAQPGDATLDGAVDLSDLTTLLAHLGQPSSAWTDGNFDGQPTIDLNDLNTVLNNLGNTYANNAATYSLLPSTASAPEPATMALLAPLLLLARTKKSPFNF